MPSQSDRRPAPPRGLARFEDDDFDGEPYDDGPSHPTLAGMYGFIIAMVSLGLLGVVVALWILLQQENQMQADDRTLWMFSWFLFLDLISFVGGLAATILGARGMARSNPLYRGFSVAAMILGILELAVTSIFGLFFFCCTTGLLLNRGGMG